jgi:hypothetical protein
LETASIEDAIRDIPHPELVEGRNAVDAATK